MEDRAPPCPVSRLLPNPLPSGLQVLGGWHFQTHSVPSHGQGLFLSLPIKRWVPGRAIPPLGCEPGLAHPLQQVWAWACFSFLQPSPTSFPHCVTSRDSWPVTGRLSPQRPIWHDCGVLSPPQVCDLEKMQ